VIGVILKYGVGHIMHITYIITGKFTSLCAAAGTTTSGIWQCPSRVGASIKFTAVHVIIQN